MRPEEEDEASGRDRPVPIASGRLPGASFRITVGVGKGRPRKMWGISHAPSAHDGLDDLGIIALPETSPGVHLRAEATSATDHDSSCGGRNRGWREPPTRGWAGWRGGRRFVPTMDCLRGLAGNAWFCTVRWWFLFLLYQVQRGKSVPLFIISNLGFTAVGLGRVILRRDARVKERVEL